MKLVGTRIRIEKSKHKTEYFPQYCLEEKTWWGLGKPKLRWYGVSDHSTHKFGEARCAVNTIPKLARYSLEWAQEVIDYQAHYWAKYLEAESHEENKEITYVKYP